MCVSKYRLYAMSLTLVLTLSYSYSHVYRWMRDGSVHIYRSDGSTLIKPTQTSHYIQTNVNGTRCRVIPPLKRPNGRSSNSNKGNNSNSSTGGGRQKERERDQSACVYYLTSFVLFIVCIHYLPHFSIHSPLVSYSNYLSCVCLI